MDVLIADFSLFNHVLFMLILIITNDFLNFIEIMNWVFEIEVSIFGYENRECRVPVRGVLYCRCERTKTQQAQYNEFGREAGLRTGPLRGLRQRSSRIANDVEEGWKSILGLVRGWVLVLLLWYYTTRVFRCLPNCPPFLWDLFGYIFFYSPHPGRPSVDCAGCYLSVCPIQRFPQLAMGCSRQGDTIQGSFLH